MAKKKIVPKKATANSAAEAAPSGGEGLQVPKNQVGAAIQAMISFEGATHVDAVALDATTFTITRLA